MKKQQGASALTLIILLAVVVGIGTLVYTQMIAKSATPSEQPRLGGDRDANGCITSAGYAWCEANQKCQRVWEGPCPSNNEE